MPPRRKNASVYVWDMLDKCRGIQIKVFHDRTGNTLTVWWGNPQDEYVCQETGDEVVLMKDKSGQVIGFERLNFSTGASEPVKVSFEAAVG